jgi:hypothetical protein
MGTSLRAVIGHEYGCRGVLMQAPEEMLTYACGVLDKFNLAAKEGD